MVPPKTIPILDDLRIFHIKILNKLIEIAKKGAYFTVPAKEEWRCFDQVVKESDEPLLEEWLDSLNYSSNWKYLSTDKNNPKRTYIVEIIK